MLQRGILERGVASCVPRDWPERAKVDNGHLKHASSL